MSAWGASKPASIMTPDTPEQIKARKLDEAARNFESEANRLIGLVYAKIAGQSGGSAANYPGDKQYSIAEEFPTPVVERAAQIWEGTEGIGYHTKTSVKVSGGRDGKTQTNFICKVIGPPTQKDFDAMQSAKLTGGRADGLMHRHNVHVTHQ